MVAFVKADAQLCQGSLGDPIVNITFGAGGNPGAPLSAATTTYQYTSTDCPNDGFYTVRNSTSGCFGDTWHSVASDHTGDPNGYFMLVNASLQPSAFYVDTVKGLCGGTTYEFAAWVMNVIRSSACGGSSILPDLTFRIEKRDGTILQTYNTNGIAASSSPVWKQYGSFFTTPAGVSDIVLRMINNAQGGCGNDLMLDDITFRPCGPSLTPSIAGLPTNTASFCEGTAQSYTINCTVSGGFSNPVFQWQKSDNNGAWTDMPGANSSSLTVNFPAGTLPGTYRYRLAVAEAGNIGFAQCRIASAPVTIQVNANPVTNAGSNNPVCENSVLNLTAGGGGTYQWSGPNGFTAAGPNPSIAPVQLTGAGKYYVLVTSAANCSHLDSVIVTVNTAPVAQTAFASASICPGNSIQLSGSGGTAWEWTPATGLSSTVVTNPVAAPADTTHYLFIASNTAGCKDTAFTTINVTKKPVVNAGPDQTIIGGNRIFLNGRVTGNYVDFFWTPNLTISNVRDLRAAVNPTADISYVLHAEAINGCGFSTDTMNIKAYQALYIPNAFTPDGNGINDTWYIPALAAYEQHELYVLNRYGEIVFQSKGLMRRWDGKYKGKDLPAGAYTYFLDLKQGFGSVKGSVLIIR